MPKSEIKILSGALLALGLSAGVSGQTLIIKSELIPNIKTFPFEGEKSAQSIDDVAHEAMLKKAEILKQFLNSTELKLDYVKKSLLGKHFHYKQYVNDLKTLEGQYVVSVSFKNGAIYQEFDRTVTDPVDPADEKSRGISEEEAIQLAWEAIKGRGSLLADVTSETILYRSNKGQRSAFQVRIGTEAPFGYWKILIDEKSGQILDIGDERITRNPIPSLEELNKLYFGEAGDLKSYRSKYQKSQQFLLKNKSLSNVQDGRAMVFDPDPRTSLNDESIANDSDAGVFTDAYFERVLKELTFENSIYHLRGPWVNIKDFESPNIAPGTTTDGFWNYTRDNVAFHDAMTYFHLDQNQRYMQSLGFVGETGIQFGPIETDANGLGRADNSHYIPGSNRMAFGHGCVPDNEDADVILHEYGHAIHHSINSDWGGGDSGAMGEGFGDYWAASYSITTANGRLFKPFQVFSWDGPDCWPGRRLDKLNATYDHGQNYSAHSNMGGFVSDELWSTPLFQALWKLTEDGYLRENVDKIILEAHFGVGSGMKMRGMAEAIIRTSKMMFAEGPYANAFLQSFIKHKIIEMPSADVALKSVSFTGAGPNQVPDPGETLGLLVRLKNTGTHNASQIRGVLVSRHRDVQVERGAVTFPDMNSGGESSGESEFFITLSRSMMCGDQFGLSLQLRFEGGATSESEISIDLGTGVAELLNQQLELSPPKEIPDNSSEGLTSSFEITDSGQIRSGQGPEVSLNISHTYIGDLQVSLTSPSGKKVLLHNRTGGSQDNLQGIYPLTLSPAESLASLSGESLQGIWTLNVQDLASRDTGALNQWGLKAVKGWTCESVVPGV